MSITVNELKRIFKLKYIFIAVIFLVLTGMIFPGEFIESVKFINKTHTDNYPDQIPLDFNSYSLELMFKDMLLEKYGETIEKDELNLIKSQFNDFSKNVVDAAEKDEMLKRVGLVLNDNYEFVSVYSPDDSPVFSDEEQEYQWECVNGTKKLEGTEYPLYFLQAFRSLISDAEGYNKDSYPIMSSTLLGGISDNICMVFMAATAMLIIIIPYATEQKRNNTIAVGYSSKTGRKLYLYKLISVVISSVLFIGVFVIFSVIMFKCCHVQRYYHCIIDSNLFQKNNNKLFGTFYSGISFLWLYAGLILFIFICGVLTSATVYVIASNFDNIISSIAACIPIIAVNILIFYRYIIYALDISKGVLMFNFEPIFTGVILLLILTFALTLSYKKQNKYDI